MTRKLGMIAAVAMAFTLMLALAGCSCSSEQDKTVETKEFSGVLTAALGNDIEVKGDSGEMVFSTDQDTTYELGNQEQLAFGDEVKVSYHEADGKNQAEKVELVKHEDPTVTFEGDIVAYGDERILVANKSLTVTFTMDSKTTITGNLGIGNTVEVAYTGDLSESPHADSIKVIKEAPKPEPSEVSGIISEMTDKTFMLAIDSAHSYRLAYDGKTKVSGVDKTFGVGDVVKVTFVSENKQDPHADAVEILQKALEQRLTVNGTIDKVENGKITLKADTGIYVFTVNADTKYSGDNLAEGYKSEITYTGKLSDQPVAVNVYCVKVEETPATPDEKAKNEAAENTNANNQAAGNEEEPEGNTQDGSKNTAADNTSNASGNAANTSNASNTANKNASSTKPGGTKTEKELIVAGKGTIVKGDEKGKSVVVKFDNGKEVTLKIDSGTTISSGYFPMKGDVVIFKYDKDEMLLKDIQLMSRDKAPVIEEVSGDDASNTNGNENADANGNSTLKQQSTDDEADEEADDGSGQEMKVQGTADAVDEDGAEDDGDATGFDGNSEADEG